MAVYGYYGESGALLDVGYTCPPKNRFKTNVFYPCDVLSSGEVVGHGGRIKGVDVVGFRFTSKHCGEVRVLNPIVDWTDGDVWEFLDSQGCEANPLYQCGFKRVGCIGCPQCYYKARESESTRYPGYKSMYLKAFERMLEVRAARTVVGGSKSVREPLERSW